MASRVLRDVTNYKGARLVEQQAWYEERKRSLLEKAEKSDDPVAALLEGLGELGFKSTLEPVCYPNIRLMHKQSQHDASVPYALVRQWRDDLKRLLDIKSTKYEYAALFSKLATEWVDKPNDANVLLGSLSGESDISSQSKESSFLPDDSSAEPVQVGREDMQRQRQQWDSFVFSERQTSKQAIKDYLEDLFVQPQSKDRVTKSAFDYLHEAMRKFGLNEETEISLSCSTDDVKTCAKAVLKADLFTGQKRDELLGLKDARPAVLKEVADVMNMGLDSLEIWQWKPSPIPARMRRQLNGKYRVYMDPEIHQALLIQWIGTNFAFALKRFFKTFYRSKSWLKSTHNSMSNQDRTRASYYLSEDQSTIFYNSVLHSRREQFKDDFLMTQLPSSLREGNRDYDCNDDSDEDDDNEGENVGKSPLNVKQTLLRVATTELLVQKKIYGRFTLCTTDFKWFGPSLPHDTIFSVLEFLGVHEKWLTFFKKFLSMPLFFPQDGPDAEVRTRKCGVPISQTLSDAFGEAVLFCLDFAVSKASKGSCQLYRFHDDVWFWGQQKDCEKVWQTINSFTKVMGLELNQEKTGSVQIGGAPSNILPDGPVQWGFLKLDAAKARWTVDMTQVDEHVVEIRRQLAQCRSVFSWIQAWNSYITSFLRNNFGHASNCLGSEHLDMVFSIFRYIQEKLFMDESGLGDKDVTSYLKSAIEKRYGAKNIANAFLYWPAEFGGLDLRNPFIPLLTVRNNCMEDPSKRIDEAFEREEELYEAAKATFERGKNREHKGTVPPNCDPEEFFSFEEYVRFREETSEPLKQAYEALLESPKVDSVKYTRACDVALHSIRPGSKSIKTEWSEMDSYWRWILQLYAGEVMERFGGLVLGEKEYLPVELVNLMKSERVRWQG